MAPHNSGPRCLYQTQRQASLQRYRAPGCPTTSNHQPLTLIPRLPSAGPRPKAGHWRETPSTRAQCVPRAKQHMPSPALAPVFWHTNDPPGKRACHRARASAPASQHMPVGTLGPSAAPKKSSLQQTGRPLTSGLAPGPSAASLGAPSARPGPLSA